MKFPGRHMLSAACLGLMWASVSAVAADQKNKPQTSQPGPVAAQSAASILVARPDFVVRITVRTDPADGSSLLDGSFITENIGDADYTKTVSVDVTCKVVSGGAIAVAPSQGGGISNHAPTPSCGPAFTGGTAHFDFANFPAGHGPHPNAPVEPPPGTSIIDNGNGRIVTHMAMPKGTFEMTATVDPGNKIAEKDETNNVSTATGKVK